MESGRQRIRRLYTEPIEVMEVTWNFTVDEYSTFRDFFIHTLQQGSLPFEMETKEFAPDPDYIRVYTRQYAFLNGTYEFSRSDNLFSVRTTLEIDAEVYEEVPINEPDLPDLVPEQPACLHTVSFTWDYAAGDVVQVAMALAGPWYDYITPIQTESEVLTGKKTVVLNNDFGGLRYFRIKGGNGQAKTKPAKPLAATVSPPQLTSFTNLSPSPRLLRKVSEDDGIYETFSRIENSLIHPFDVYVEPKDRLEYDYGTGQGAKTFIPTFEVPAGAELRWTRDGSDPTLEMKWPPAKIDGADYNAGVYRNDFVGVIKARCFKDGCPSPLMVILVDKRYNELNEVWPFGDFGAHSMACYIGTVVNGDIWYPGQGSFCKDQCGIPLTREEVWDCLFPYLRSEACSNTLERHVTDMWDYTTVTDDTPGGQPVENRQHWVTYDVERAQGPFFTGLATFPGASVSVYRFRMKSMVGRRVTSWNYRPVLNESICIDGDYIESAGLSGVGGSWDVGFAAATSWCLSQRWVDCESQKVITEYPVGSETNKMRQEGTKFTSFEVVTSCYEDFFSILPPPDVVPDLDPETLPDPPEVDDTFFETWEEYDDGDAESPTLEGGQGWDGPWSIVTLPLNSGYEDWEFYEDASVNTTEDNANLLEAEQVFYSKGEGWVLGSSWAFFRDPLNIIDYVEDWESYDEESDGTVTTSTGLRGGLGWKTDGDEIEPWSIFDYAVEINGVEDWQSYVDGTIPIVGTPLDDGVGFGTTAWAVFSY